MCWSSFRTECIAYLVHLSSPYKYADKQSAPGRSLPNGSNSSVVRGESCDTCVSPLLCLIVSPSDITGASRNSRAFNGSATVGTGREEIFCE